MEEEFFTESVHCSSFLNGKLVQLRSHVLLQSTSFKPYIYKYLTARAFPSIQRLVSLDMQLVMASVVVENISQHYCVYL